MLSSFEGFCEGDELGSLEGLPDIEGFALGADDGIMDGFFEGFVEGTADKEGEILG